MRFLQRYTAHMTTQRWMALPACTVAVEDMRPTQAVHEPLWPERRPDPAACADPLIHVVRLDGVLWVQDGHHRLARARRRGDASVQARILEVSPIVYIT